MRGVDVAVQRDRAVGVTELDPHSVAGGRAGVDDHAVGDRVDRCADRVGQVDAGVQDAPPVAEARGEDALGRHDEQRLLQPGLTLGAFLSERDAVGQLGVVHGDVRGRLHGHHLYTAAGGADRPAVSRCGLGGQHGLGLGVIWGLGGGVRSGGGGAGRHRADQHATSSRAAQLFAVLPAPGHQLRVAATAVRVTPRAGRCGARTRWGRPAS